MEALQLHGAVVTDNPCGCRIAGAGTLQSPLHIYWCERHAVINEIRELAPMAVNARGDHDAARERKRAAEAELLEAVITETRFAIPMICGPEGSPTEDWAELLPSYGKRCGLAIDKAGQFLLLGARDADGAVRIDCCIEGASAAETYGLHAILDALADKLDAALGHAKSAAKSDKRVAIIDAVTMLLRKGEKP